MVSVADFDPWSRGSRTITSKENKVGAMCQKKFLTQSEDEHRVTIRLKGEYLHVEVFGIAENGTNRLCLSLHVDFLDLTGLR